MRGDGDAAMSENTNVKLLEDIVKNQRRIIEKVTKHPAKATPQVWALYKEVLDYYDKGMRKLRRCFLKNNLNKPQGVNPFIAKNPIYFSRVSRRTSTH